MPEMRSPDGKVYNVSDEDVATLQRDQGWTLGSEAPAEPAGPTTILKSREGRLYEARSPEEAEQLQRDQGMVLASDEETASREHSRELYGKYGSTGQQALGLAEAFYRNASLGAIEGIIGDEQEMRERAQVTREQSPIPYALASAAPAVAAGVATGGAGLGVAGTVAAEGAIGGLANLSADEDAAFVEDRELSAEQAWGSFGKGALLGAGTAGAFMGAARAIAPGSRAVRNRFAEAAGRAERRAEKAAFRSVGIDDPVDGLADAVVKPAKGAVMRERGRAAAVQVKEDLRDVLTRLDDTEIAARRWTPEATEAAGDAGVQRAEIRTSLDALRKDLEPIASAEERGVVSRAFDMIDRADSPSDLYTAVSLSKQAFADRLGAAGNKATAEALERAVQRLEKLESNSELFGPPAATGAERAQALQDLGEARAALHVAFSKTNYLENVGMRGGSPIEEALDTYSQRLSEVLAVSKGFPEAAQAKAALRDLQKIRTGPMREVAGANQIDAMSAFTPDELRPQGPGATQAILDAAEQAAKFAAAPQYQAYKLAKIAWKGRKLLTASPERRAAALKDVAWEAAGFVDPMVAPLKLAYKYRHHIAVLADTAREEAEAAAHQMVNAVKREGAPALAERYAKQVFTEKQYNETRKAVELLAKEPDRLAEKLAGELGNLPSEAPELVMALNARGAAAVQFLASKVPPSFGFSLFHPEGPPPSKVDMVSMSLYMRGVSEPTEVQQAIADGSAMPEEVEGFRAVYPRRFKALQTATHEAVQLAIEKGQTIPAQRIATLENVLDMPGQLEPAFSDRIATVYAQAMADKAADTEKRSSYVPPPRAGARTAPTGEQTA